MAMEEQPQVLIFPFPALGHITPLFHLAQNLASLSIVCKFLTPARFHARLQACPNDLLLIDALDGLPSDPSYEPTPHDFLRSLQSLELQVDQLLHSHTPHFVCFISDNVIPWVQAVADRSGVPRIDFWPVSAMTVSMVYHMPLLASNGHIPFRCKRGAEEDYIISCIPGLPELRATEFLENVLAEDNNSDFRHKLYFNCLQQFDRAERVFVHSVLELEKEAIDALGSKIKLYPVGPLLPQHLLTDASTNRLAQAASPAKRDTCLEWLDSQAPSSVLYVAFGSTGTWSAAEMKDLAMGLEASEQPFLWAVRAALLPDDPSDLLSPETRGRCLIVRWAPQLAVLEHPAVGGFLTHCGWNSVMESLYMGVPMIGWPKVMDHTTNVRLVSVEWKVGIALARSRDAEVTSGAVEKAVRALLQGQEGKEARKRAAELKTMIRAAAMEGGSSRENLKIFAKDIISRHRSFFDAI